MLLIWSDHSTLSNTTLYHLSFIHNCDIAVHFQPHDHHHTIAPLSHGFTLDIILLSYSVVRIFAALWVSFAAILHLLSMYCLKSSKFMTFQFSFSYLERIFSILSSAYFIAATCVSHCNCGSCFSFFLSHIFCLSHVLFLSLVGSHLLFASSRILRSWESILETTLS